MPKIDTKRFLEKQFTGWTGFALWCTRLKFSQSFHCRYYENMLNKTQPRNSNCHALLISGFFFWTPTKKTEAEKNSVLSEKTENSKKLSQKWPEMGHFYYTENGSLFRFFGWITVSYEDEKKSSWFIQTFFLRNSVFSLQCDVFLFFCWELPFLPFSPEKAA